MSNSIKEQLLNFANLLIDISENDQCLSMSINDKDGTYILTLDRRKVIKKVGEKEPKDFFSNQVSGSSDTTIILCFLKKLLEDGKYVSGIRLRQADYVKIEDYNKQVITVPFESSKWLMIVNVKILMDFLNSKKILSHEVNEILKSMNTTLLAKYLKTHISYIGTSKATKFNNLSLRAMVFDWDKIY